MTLRETAAPASSSRRPSPAASGPFIAMVVAGAAERSFGEKPAGANAAADAATAARRERRNILHQDDSFE
jgi:hypothetical protein